jgi:hypothetical protein
MTCRHIASRRQITLPHSRNNNDAHQTLLVTAPILLWRHDVDEVRARGKRHGSLRRRVRLLSEAHHIPKAP